MPDDPLADLERFNRARFQRVWNAMTEDQPLEDEDALLGRLMEEHLDYHEAWYDPESYKEGEVLVDDVDPFVHLTIHALVEKKLESGQPAQLAYLMDEFEKIGLTQHEAVHVVCRVLAHQLFDRAEGGAGFSDRRFVRDLQTALEAETRRKKRKK